MNEMPGVEVPAVAPPGQPPAFPMPDFSRMRVMVADTEYGTVTDLATGEVSPLARRCAHLPAYECHCDSAAQCPVLREHPAEAAAELARQRAEAGAQAASDDGPPEPVSWAPPGAQAAAASEPAAAAPPARPLTPNGRPQLIHSGNYGLYLTPEGSYHLVYQRTAGTHPDTGQVLAIDGSPQMHMRDLPERAANMVMAIMDRDTPLPPMIETLIFGGGKPNLRAILAAVKSTGMDDLMNLAGGGDDAG